MALDLENREPSYLCGRLFAVLERIQLDIIYKNYKGKETNRKNRVSKTIKDIYFTSACINPCLIFPELIRISNNNLSKLDCIKNLYYQDLILEIMDKLESKFPSNLNEENQGKFIVGYYHQNRSLFVNTN